MIQPIIIPRPFDRHLHLRHGKMLKTVLPHSLNQRLTGALIMSNLTGENITPVWNIARAKEYNAEILESIPQGSDFKPRLALYLTDDISPEEVVEGYNQGLWCAVKLYMANQQGQGGTTGSAHGVRNLRKRYRVFEAMEKHNIPLLGHFEAVEYGVDEFDREVCSMERDLIPLRSAFPGLQIVFEHITDSRAADYVAESDGPIFATVTAHHLMLNRNDMFWGGMNPLVFCKPVAKREEHRLKIRQYVTSGNPRFGAGTDSAPHDVANKSKCCGCAAGIFTAPIAIELYAEVFYQESALAHLGNFLSRNFLYLYQMEPSEEMITIEHAPQKVPVSVSKVGVNYGPGLANADCVRVFKGGETIPWKLV